MPQPGPAGHVGTSRPTFRLKAFAPAWGAAVMGTSALAVALQVVGEGTVAATATSVAARVVLALAVGLGAVVLGTTFLRWVRHPADAAGDLRHPIKGGMSATAAGGLLTLAVAIGRVGGQVLPGGLVDGAVIVLTALGAALALVIGWEFLAAAFTAPRTELGQLSGAWFVPPVVTIIVPLALLPVIEARPAAAADLLIVAWAFLGIGAVLYLTVTAALFLRSVSHPLPPAALAPTLFIGMGPAGLISLDLVRLAEVSARSGIGAALPSVVLPVATMMWGFGLWWMVSALLVLRRGYESVPFALSWWGFTFPLAAWTIGTIALGRAWDSELLGAMGWLATASLSVLWGYVAVRTLAGLRSGTIWLH